MSILGLRKYLSWLFAFSALVCLQMTILFIPNMIREYPRAIALPFSSRLLVFFLPWVLPLQSVVFGMAWWTSFKAKRSARFWGIIASLINVAVALFPLAITPHSLFNAFLPILGLGIVGLVAFARPVDASTVAVELHEALPIPGDCTNRLLNKFAPLLLLIAGGAAFSWWLSWVRTEGITSEHSNSYFMLGCFLLGLLVVALHEIGHTAIGMILGMKLRAFRVGPFHSSIRDGKWEFRFEPKQILFDSGATGMVPTVIDFPRWASVCVLLGGVLVNVITGVYALYLAFTVEPESALQAGGFLALFGAWSLAVSAVNLIPFRMQGYSDGAQIAQLFASSVWADVHRALSIAGATLVTPLRPRDYDIAVITRASRAVTEGPHGLILRLFAYTHFLDAGDIAKAGEALTEGAAIYHESASNVPADLVAVFVFGTAYIWRDAERTKAWWRELEGKKPVRHNSEYWLANSALRWLEGDLVSAHEALQKASLLAGQLPAGGAYEFDRHCCSLLEHCLAKASVAHQ